MKKRLTLLVLVLIFALALSACGCKHSTWIKADCETAKTCDDCGKTEGEPLGHNWKEATCDTGKTCENCGRVEGAALGHSWLDATTEAPKTCENCGLTEGERIITDERFTTAATADIQGIWRYDLDMTGEMMDIPDFEGALSFAMIMELKNDGTMEISFELGDTSDLEAYMIESIYKEYEVAGMDRAAADEDMMATSGMTVEEYVEFTMGTADMDSIMGFFSFNGVYYVENGVLYLGMGWNSELEGEAFILEGDTLTLMTEAPDGSGTTVMTRVSEEG